MSETLYCEECKFGGRAFEIREKLFCSPSCGNKHFDLHLGDEDYWENDEDEEEDEDEYEDETDEEDEEEYEEEEERYWREVNIRKKWIEDYNNSLPQKVIDGEFGEVTIAIGGIYDGEAEMYEFDNRPSPRISAELEKNVKN